MTKYNSTCFFSDYKLKQSTFGVVFIRNDMRFVVEIFLYHAKLNQIYKIYIFIKYVVWEELIMTLIIVLLFIQKPQNLKYNVSDKQEKILHIMLKSIM